MKKIAIVTVNYNTAEDTKLLLQSLKHLQTEGMQVDIIVVDNGSKEVLKLTDAEQKQALLIRLEKNTGFAGGYNLGMKEALKRGAEYVFIINNDTLVDPQCLKELVSVLESDKTIGIVTPKIYFAKGHEFHKERYKKDELGRVFWFAGGYTDWANVKSVHRGVDEVDYGQYDRVEQITFATGCCMMFKREVLEHVGFFDEDFFLYYEDADLNERVQRAGYKVYYVPTAKIVHVNAASSGGAGNELQDYFITRNQMLFGMRYAPLRAKLALVRQSVRLIRQGRPRQKQAIRDYYLHRLGRGTFFGKS